jgi:hypothetical protein
VQAQVSEIMREAASRGSVPVLVTFNIPGRDCEPAGAVDEAAYENWIDAFARGIGGVKAVVILEPDSLANLRREHSGVGLQRLRPTWLADFGGGSKPLRPAVGQDRSCPGFLVP